MNSAEDIIKAVQTYLETPDTKYAIMIDGDWGCGKTHLWENTIYPNVGKKEAIYVSMFGLKDIKDIENEIFKTISMVGTDEEGILKGILNSNSEIADDIKFGGLGFAVQFALKKWKETKIKKSKSLFICFDDLERWAGNIEICLSYINKLVEHEGAKCLIIGNAKEIEEKNKIKFNSSKEKTIRFKYKLSYPASIVLEAALSIVSFQSDECKIYINQLLNRNTARIVDLLDSVKCSNIRTISRSIYYLSIIYSCNKSYFDHSPSSAVSYFVSLLSALILVEHYRNSDKERNMILNVTEDNIVNLLEQLDIDALASPEDFSGEDQIVLDLFNNAFSHSNRIKNKGKLSIIKNGFYKKNDFDEEFLEWKTTEDYEYYIDTYKFWNLDDSDAEEVFNNIYKSMFEDKDITNPSILLLLTDRLLNDIKRGIINLDFENIKDTIRKLIEELYSSNKMDCEKNISLRYGIKKFKYCVDIYEYIIKLNKEYCESKEEYELSTFWINMKENPKSLNDLMYKFKESPVFSKYDKPNEIIEALNTLSNDQLFDFTRWMGDRLNDIQGCPEAVNIEYERAQIVEKLLENKYGGKFGVKAGHMKQILRILKNKRTDYDPNYIDEQKKIMAGKKNNTEK